jgi:uncharacterized RmlC-like cupin family protein
LHCSPRDYNPDSSTVTLLCGHFCKHNWRNGHLDGTAEPHFHANYETAIYLLKGRVETRYGRGLKQAKIAEAGDFIFVPPGVPHQPHNLSADEPAYALVARNDPNEQENVVLYDPTLESE